MSTNDMQSCIEACTQCHQTCLETAMNHCLETGGKHVEAGHFRVMLNCANMCQTSANFMLSGSDFSDQVCAVCAEICEACADSCEEVGDMDDCVAACRNVPRVAAKCPAQADPEAGHTTLR